MKKMDLKKNRKILHPAAKSASKLFSGRLLAVPGLLFAQQYGITVWSVSDNTSWLYNGGKDLPLMYNSNFGKKQAYTGVLNALKGN